MADRHGLLARQIRRFFGSEEAVPEPFRAFLDAVDAAYRQADADRAAPARSLDRSSEELIQENAALRDALSVLRAELESAEERARLQSMSALGHLVGGLAHEARNPLFAISATLEAVLTTLDGTPEHAELRQTLDYLREPTARLSELMSELLEYGRPLGRNLVAGPLTPLILQAVADCRALAEARKVQVVARAGECDVTVGMIRPRLLAALTNLIQNGIQHTPPGGTVSVDVEEVMEDGRAWVRCTFRDAGPGFRDEDLPRLFEPFFTRRKGGTGLGLSIVQRVAEEQKARIRVSNCPEGGAVITFDLPRWTDPAGSP